MVDVNRECDKVKLYCKGEINMKMKCEKPEL
jgi:hypothetical protein